MFFDRGVWVRSGQDRCSSWREFRPRKKIFSPPPPKFPTNTLPATRPPHLPGRPPPPLGIFNEKLSPPPLPAPRTPPSRKNYFACSPERFCEYFFSCLPGNFALKNGGDFCWIFSGIRLPRNEARKLLEKIGENSEQNSGQNSGRKFEKFGKLSFCNFPDLRKNKKYPKRPPSLRGTPWAYATQTCGLWPTIGKPRRGLKTIGKARTWAVVVS